MFLSVSLSQIVFYFNAFSKLSKAKPSVSNSWWPLNRGENNRRTVIGAAKRWFNLQYYSSYFGTLITGRLIEGGLMAVQLYFV